LEVQALTDRTQPSSSGIAGPMDGLVSVSVTVSSEAEARAVISEQTVLAATLRSSATGAAVAAAAAWARVPVVEAAAVALQAELEEVRAERAARVRAEATQAQVAADAAAHFGGLHEVLAAVFAPASYVAPEPGSVSSLRVMAVDR